MTSPTDSNVPLSLRPTFAERRAAAASRNARIPDDPAADLVCIYDQDEPVEHARTKEIADFVRVRRYAHKRALQTDVASRYNDDPIQWYGAPQVAPPEPRVIAFVRHWRGDRPPRQR